MSQINLIGSKSQTKNNYNLYVWQTKENITKVSLRRLTREVYPTLIHHYIRPLNMKDNYNNKAEALRALRWHKIKANIIPWSFFVLSAFLCCFCPVLINYYYDSFLYPSYNAFLNALSSISAGYFTGFLVYLFINFLPSTEKEVVIHNNIYSILFEISMFLKSAETSIYEGNDKLTLEQKKQLIHRFLALSTKNEVSEDGRWVRFVTKLPINHDNHNYLESILNQLNEYFDILIKSYGRNMESDEILQLSKMSFVKKKLDMSVESNKSYYFSLFFDGFIDSMAKLESSGIAPLCNKYGHFKYKQNT